jgi:Zn-dependent peptidase ImmA (M78 family)
MLRQDRASKAARGVLHQAGISKPPIPIERLARHLGIEVRREPFEGDLSGMLFREGDRTIIGVNSLHPRSRQRFTIAHEIGHLELHDREGIHLDRKFPIVRQRDGRSSLAVDPEEIEANGFAAELLMPASMLEDDIEGSDPFYEDDELSSWLADRYDVSLQAMAIRLGNLGFQQ